MENDIIYLAFMALLFVVAILILIFFFQISLGLLKEIEAYIKEEKRKEEQETQD